MRACNDRFAPPDGFAWPRDFACRCHSIAVLLMAVAVALVPSAAIAADSPVAMLYVVRYVDLGGEPVHLVVPVEEPGLADSTPALRPKRAYAALKSRNATAYGNSSLRVESATKATLVIDQRADADLVIAEVFWTLAGMGISELEAPPAIRGPVGLDDLAYGFHVPFLTVYDLLAFPNADTVPARAFVMVQGKPVPAPEAAVRLGKGDAVMRKKIATAMTDKALRPKMAVIRALKRAKVRAAYKLTANDVLPGLVDRRLEVRLEALDAVIQAGVKGNKDVISALEKVVENDTDTGIKLRAVKALSKAGVGKYNDLLQAEKLRTGSVGEALRAVDVLSKSKQVKIAAPALASSLTHAEHAVREAALKALIDMKQFDVLHTAMSNPQLAEAMREKLATLLAESGSDQARDDALEYLITRGSVAGAIFAAQEFGKRGSKAATPHLLFALRHNAVMVRRAAANALAQIKDERAIVPLADAAQAKRADEDVMMGAATVIMKTLRQDQVIRLAKSRNMVIKRMAVMSLAKFAKGNPTIIQLLIGEMTSTNQDIKRAAVFALARIENQGLASELAKLIADPDPEIREQVAVALGNAEDSYSKAGDELMVMMRDREKKVRIAAIMGIAKRKHQPALINLQRMISYPDMLILRAVYTALLALETPDNSEQLRRAFRGGMIKRDSQVRLLCLKSLSKGTNKQDLEAIRNASFDQSKDVKLAAIEALGNSKLPEAMEVLGLWFGDEDADVRGKALDALSAIPVPEDWKDRKKRYLKDFIAAPNQSPQLVEKAKQLMAKI